MAGMIAAKRTLELVLRHDRAVTFVGLALMIVLSWAYLLGGAGMDMAASPSAADASDEVMSAMATLRPAWGLGYAVLMLAMWWVMMLAMMLPSAAPMILLFTAINRKNGDGSTASVAAFVFAYVFVWGGFSVIATASQWGLEEVALLSPMMMSTSAFLGGALLVAAGIWQLTPMKHACLRHCRSPIHILAHGWHPGARGAFRMGLEHGAFCLGCCWLLMVLLFYGGVMNLWWIVGLAVYVSIEKIVPAGHWIGRGAGGPLILWGVSVIAIAS